MVVWRYCLCFARNQYVGLPVRGGGGGGGGWMCTFPICTISDGMSRISVTNLVRSP